MNDDIEEKILSKVNKISEIEKEKTVFNHKGRVQDKSPDTLLKILNINDFDKELHGLLYDIVKDPLLKAKEQHVKEMCCYVENNQIVFEGVMEKTEKSYFIDNLIFKLYGINLVRIQTEIISIDGKPVSLAGETMFCAASNDKISGVVYETKNEYVSDAADAKEKNMKLLEKTLFTRIIDKDKRIRFSPEMGKLFIR